MKKGTIRFSLIAVEQKKDSTRCGFSEVLFCATSVI